ncbi:hypothetical protein KIN20_022475 [Parelaphostrongylus tenuis]|uniref:Uncharacterized protein n=1 Tax=Parelaphostrongylus tenuis TaxID=148309 RepID=A0AAD5N667_PARTN|nr:hypothetical protein KIN20_022475 [Parelaphostrongylus tenuis]
MQGSGKRFNNEIIPSILYSLEYFRTITVICINHNEVSKAILDQELSHPAGTNE